MWVLKLSHNYIDILFLICSICSFHCWLRNLHKSARRSRFVKKLKRRLNIFSSNDLVTPPSACSIMNQSAYTGAAQDEARATFQAGAWDRRAAEDHHPERPGRPLPRTGGPEVTQSSPHGFFPLPQQLSALTFVMAGRTNPEAHPDCRSYLHMSSTLP